MKNYKYLYCVYTNNCCNGVQFLKAFRTLANAWIFKTEYENNHGCCNVVKKRCDIATGKPLCNWIYDNYKYQLWDVYPGLIF
jgi:hypothetical protein